MQHLDGIYKVKQLVFFRHTIFAYHVKYFESDYTKWVCRSSPNFAYRNETWYVSSLANVVQLTKVWWKLHLVVKRYKYLYCVLSAFTYVFRSAFKKIIIRKVCKYVLLCLVELDLVMASYSYVSDIFLPFKSMAANRTVHVKVVKFGTNIEDSLNCYHGK